jgi:hypothetical protein
MSQFVVGPETGDEDTGPVTIYDIQAAEDRKVSVCLFQHGYGHRDAVNRSGTSPGA